MIYLRGKTWWAKWKADGTVVRKSLHTSDRNLARSLESVANLARLRAVTREQAHKLIDELIGTGESFGTPLDEAWGEYLRVITVAGRTLSPDASRRRQLCWERFAAHARLVTGAKTMNGVGRDAAVSFVAAVNRDGTKGKTRRNVLANVSAVWNTLAVGCGAPRIFDGLMPDANDSEERLAFTPEQERAILAKAKEMFGGRWWLASMIARYTGLRYSDVRTLEWADFDDRWVLRLEPNKTRRHGIRVTLPIVEPLLSALQAAKTEAKAGAVYVLPDHALLGKNAHLRKVETFAEVLKAAGVSGNYTYHSWRHTFRTRLAEGGVSDDLAKRLGGWTQDSTAARYDHAERIEELRAAIR